MTTHNNDNCDSEDILCGFATAATTLQIHPDQLGADGVLKTSPGENRSLSLIAMVLDDLNNTVSTVVLLTVVSYCFCFSL